MKCTDRLQRSLPFLAFSRFHLSELAAAAAAAAAVTSTSFSSTILFESWAWHGGQCSAVQCSAVRTTAAATCTTIVVATSLLLVAF